MKANIGAIDGGIRILIFIASLCYAIYTGAWYWAIPGAILFVTAVLIWCPLYDILGINSIEKTSGDIQ